MSTSSDSQGSRFVPRVGAVVAGKYRIERKLGEGGMGVVVAASHLSLGGQVALKFLSRGDELQQSAITRLKREAQSVARIKSDHVARVLDMGTLEAGEPYIVMEMLDGMDLHKFVRQNGPLPIADAAEFVLQAAEGVAEAHAIGIVHRDLKPANLFLTRKPDGTPFVRVLDFGIAKNTFAPKEAGEVSLTVGDDVLGSPLYMSPEQIRNPKGVDPRADIWSFGAILYKLLTGRAAFDADNPSASLAMIVMEDPTPIRRFRPDIPPELEAVIHRCLEKKLERRFQTVDEFACALLPFAPQRPRGRPWIATTIPISPAPTVTGAALPGVVPPDGPTTTAGTTVPRSIPPSQTRKMATHTLVMATIGATILLLGIPGLLFIFATKSPDQKEVAATPSPLVSTGSTVSTPPAINADPAKTVNIANTAPAAPTNATSAITPVSASPSASVAPTKSTKRPARNDALDDRL